MPKRRRASDDFDSPWKDALHHFLPAFLGFFFADIHADVDWSRGYESLDKEFQQIVRRAEVVKIFADKLFNVWLRDGSETWILIHVEVQGEPEERFPGRMFDYNSAVRRLYNHDVVSLAVLCDDDPEWRPTRFTYGRWDCRMELTFRVAKLLDHEEKRAALEASANPFAMVVQGHLDAIATRRNPEARKSRKFDLIKALLRSRLPKDDVRQLLRLIDWMMTLPDLLDEVFRNEVHRYEEENKMEYLSTFERAGFKKGHEEGHAVGRKEGHEKGREEGREEGMREGILELIELDLDTRFSVAGRRMMKKVKTLPDLAALRQFARFLKKAATIQDVRGYFA